MTKTKLVVLVCFGVAFGAGLATGVALMRFTSEHGPGSWLDHELDLTAEQREQMRGIWSQVVSFSMQRQHEQRQALLKERDEAVQGLMNDGQKAKYDEVMRTYGAKLAALEESRKKAFEEAVERTKKILTESQRKKYEELLQKHGGRHMGFGPPGRHGPGGERMPPPPPRPSHQE
jgi:Spy/CpxP family protein refolding chaperone